MKVRIEIGAPKQCVSGKRSVICVSEAFPEKWLRVPYKLQEFVIRARMSFMGCPQDNAIVLRDNWEELERMAVNGEIGTLALPSLRVISAAKLDRRFIAERVRESGGDVVSFSESDSRFMVDKPLGLALAAAYSPFREPPATFQQNLELDYFRVQDLIADFERRYGSALLNYEAALDHVRVDRRRAIHGTGTRRR